MKIKMYFLEIKNRFFLSVLSWLTVLLVCYTFKEILLFTIIKQSAFFGEPLYFIFTDVAEIFYTYITLIFFIGNQVLLVYFFYNFFIFLAPGLLYSEYSYLVFTLKISFTWFIFSIMMYYIFFFPFCWDFFLSFQQLKIIKITTLYFESKISEYLFFYTSFYYICVIYSQSFIILLLILDFSKANKELTKTFRKVFYYFFIIFSTLVTPPDIFSQLFLSACLVFSYEMLIFYGIYQKNINKALIIS